MSENSDGNMRFAAGAFQELIKKIDTKSLTVAVYVGLFIVLILALTFASAVYSNKSADFLGLHIASGSNCLVAEETFQQVTMKLNAVEKILDQKTLKLIDLRAEREKERSQPDSSLSNKIELEAQIERYTEEINRNKELIQTQLHTLSERISIDLAPCK